MEDDSKLFKISVAPEVVKVGVPIYNVDLVYDLNSNCASEAEEKPKTAKLSKNSCWNCGGNHSLRQCKLPHNGKRISQNKAKFTTRSEFKRYHSDIKKNTYRHLTPGVISDKLREALGIKKDQLPPYVYKMRTLGYPPGWLLYAKTEYSGIEMFDTDGNRIPNADEEEGEIGFPGERVSYDESKIITYPGFNSWPEPGIKDETKKYGAPELHFVPSKEEFIKSLKSLNASVYYHRNMIQSVTAGESDMEAEETEDIQMLPDDNKCAFIPPLPDETDCPLPPPPPPENTDVQNSPQKESNSDKTGSLSNDKSSSENQDDSMNMYNMSMDTPGSSHGTTKSIDYGTPVLKIHSPYCKLPPPEAFKKDISDVINFENLPDSTGAYERLKGVLKYARSKMSYIKENKMNNTI